MPTPVNHLVMAQELRLSERLSAPAGRLIEAEWGAFLLGNTAPDVQTVSGQSRDHTHFYPIPPPADVPACHAFLAAHPGLARADRLPPGHAAFLAGYLAHLLADEAWWWQIFAPLFGADAGWGSWRERVFLHNVLRTYLDRQDQTRLNGNIGHALRAAEPRGWLPFVSDEALRAWRDLLTEQLRPGQTVRTAEVFAARMGIPAELVETTLLSSEQMERIFRHAPPARLAAYRTTVLHKGAEQINSYLGGKV